MPLLREEVAAFKKFGAPVIHHSDGNISLLLPLLVQTEIDRIQSIDPSARMDIGKVKQEYGDRLTLDENIDSDVVLSLGLQKRLKKP